MAGAGSGKPVPEEVCAAWASTLRAGALPTGVIERAKRALLDWVAVAVAGTSSDAGAFVRSFVSGRHGPCSVIGSPISADPQSAALANGMLGHALDFDDNSRSAIGHLTTVVAPAVLAAAELRVLEDRELSGEVLASGFVAGVEVAAWIGRAVNPAAFRAGVFTTAALGAVGAAAGASRTLGLRPAETRHALAIAAGPAGGTRVNNGTSAKPYHAGSAARAGLEAALAAKLGLTAAPDALSGPMGLVAHLGGDRSKLAAALEGLGARFELVDPGLEVKLHPCCSAAAAAVDAAIALRGRLPSPLSAVASLRCRVTQQVRDSLPFTWPRTWREAQFSLPFCVSFALVHGRLGLDALDDGVLRDPELSRIGERVEAELAPAHLSLGPEGAQVELVLADGRSFQETWPVGRGSPELPLSDEELLSKVRECCKPSLDDEAVQEIVEAVSNLERRGVVDLVGALARGRG
jgi:2-methylcitrate dehydratase PrpD